MGSFAPVQDLRTNATCRGNPPVVAEPVEAWSPRFHTRCRDNA